MTAIGQNHLQQAEVERIVREVLAGFLGPTAKPVAAGGELRLSSRVVTLKDLAGRLDGVTRIVAPRGAVFTPAARDELRKLKIAIASAVSLPTAAANGPLLLAVVETKQIPAPLIAMLAQGGTTVDEIPAVGLVDAVQRLSEQLGVGNRQALLVTDQAAAALCLANRRQGVRAALGSSVAAVAEALVQVAPNLLIVDPRGRSVFEIRQMTRLWHAAGARPCPEQLRQYLG